MRVNSCDDKMSKLSLIPACSTVTFVYFLYCRWAGLQNVANAELCFCRSIHCRGLIADPLSDFMENSIRHYVERYQRLMFQHKLEEEFLRVQAELLDCERETGAQTEDQDLKLARRQEKNDTLQMTCERIQMAVVKARKAIIEAGITEAGKQSKRFVLLQFIPKPILKRSTSQASMFCYGWDGMDVRRVKRNLRRRAPDSLPLSLAFACGVQPLYPYYKPPWRPAGSHNMKGVHVVYRPRPPFPCAPYEPPVLRKVRPQQPMLRPFEPIPSDCSQWPEEGFMTSAERQRVMSWFEGTLSGRDESRSIYPSQSSLTFAYWMHLRLRKPSAQEMQTFKFKWSGISTQELLQRYEDESGETRPPEKVVRCILSDVLTYFPFRYNSDVKMVESKSYGNNWPFAWLGLLRLPGAVPDFSGDLPENQRPVISELTLLPSP